MEVFLKITGTAKTDTEDTTETLTGGTCYRKNGLIYLFYDGADDDTPSLITKHRITISGERVEIQKTGAVRSLMIVERGEVHACDYATPFGILKLEFAGHGITVTEERTRIRIALSYDIRIEGNRISSNYLEIEATPYREGEYFPEPEPAGTGADRADERPKAGTAETETGNGANPNNFG